MPSSEVRKLFVDSVAAYAARLRTMDKRLRAAHPNLPPEVYAFVRAELEAAMGLMADDVRKLADK